MSAPSGFSPDVLAEIRARLPLESIIGRRVTLKRSGDGRSWRGKCPFHGGRSPSFSICGRGFRCFSCGEHDDHSSYTMWSERVGFAATGQLLEAGQQQDDAEEIAQQARERAEWLAQYLDTRRRMRPSARPRSSTRAASGPPRARSPTARWPSGI